MEDKNYKKIIVIGGGFIGVELSDELTKAGKEVTLVESNINHRRCFFKLFKYF